MLLGLWQAHTPAVARKGPPRGDIVLFRAVVERVRAGQPYYPSMRTELQARSYPTASIFNWRPPATFVLLASNPRIAHILMGILACTAVVLTIGIFRNASPVLLGTAILLQLGAAVLPSIPSDGLYMPETWAGILLLLSISAYTLGARRSAVCFAVAALCAREIALPYVAASCALAAYERQTDELRWYAVGLGVFSVYYGAHVAMSAAHIQPGDMAHTGSWIAFGGWRFVVRTVNMGGWFLILPAWTAAIGAVLVLASVLGPADRHLKAMVITYMIGFAVVGQSFNDYWGLMTGPTWGLAIVYGVIGIGRLLGFARTEIYGVAPGGVGSSRLDVSVK
jgi:hypothetical protein